LTQLFAETSHSPWFRRVQIYSIQFCRKQRIVWS